MGQTSRMRMRALERLGHEVRGVNTIAPWKRLSWASRRAQRYFQAGPIIEEINRAVLAAAREFRPDLVWGEKQEYLHADTLRQLRAQGARLIHFTPDPYFSLSWKRTRLMDAAIGEFDVLVYCKRYEEAAYRGLGKKLVYMALGYCDEVHRPLPSRDARWSTAIGFLGGWEPRRQRLLHAAGEAAELKIWGGYWDFVRDGKWSLRRRIILGQLAGGAPFRIRRDEVLARALQGGEVYGDDYARALSGARIGMGFLRQVCPDQHTTRSFEIPACGSMLLADRTEEHAEFFTEGKEAEFFSTQEEMLDKVRFYSAEEGPRAKIAAAGYRRCTSSGYDYVHRLKAALAEAGIA